MLGVQWFKSSNSRLHVTTQTITRFGCTVIFQKPSSPFKHTWVKFLKETKDKNVKQGVCIVSFGDAWESSKMLVMLSTNFINLKLHQVCNHEVTQIIRVFIHIREKISYHPYIQYYHPNQTVEETSSLTSINAMTTDSSNLSPSNRDTRRSSNHQIHVLTASLAEALDVHCHSLLFL